MQVQSFYISKICFKIEIIGQESPVRQALHRVGSLRGIQKYSTERIARHALAPLQVTDRNKSKYEARISQIDTDASWTVVTRSAGREAVGPTGFIFKGT